VKELIKLERDLNKDIIIDNEPDKFNLIMVWLLKLG
jgi:hypothetical protein